MSDPLTRDQIRDRVQLAIERRLGVRAFAETSGPPPVHSSHARFRLSEDAEASRACLIEPAVNCIGCGYCRSYGH